MKFTPFTNKYSFEGEPLLDYYPDYMRSAISQWLYDCLNYTNAIDSDSFYRKTWLTQSFKHSLEITFRETVPTEWNEFLHFLFADSERLSNFIALCLQNYAQLEHAQRLEKVLADGGSAFAVKKVEKTASEYDRGAYDLVLRVPETVQKAAAKAISQNSLIDEAWTCCYSRNPNYEKVVTKCCDFVEGFLRDKYWLNEKRTKQISAAISEFKKNPSLLRFKGDTFLSDKAKLIGLLEGIAAVRGQHTTGMGKTPTQEEAEYILHTTIYIWNLHQ